MQIKLYYHLSQEIARHLRPRTLRALFGVDKVRNAVHCTDLPEDGLLEVCPVIVKDFFLMV